MVEGAPRAERASRHVLLRDADAVLIERWWGSTCLSSERFTSSVMAGEVAGVHVFVPEASIGKSLVTLVEQIDDGCWVHCPSNAQVREFHGGCDLVMQGFSLRISDATLRVRPRRRWGGDRSLTRVIATQMIAALICLGLLAVGRRESDRLRERGDRSRLEAGRALMFQLLVRAQVRDLEPDRFKANDTPTGADDTFTPVVYDYVRPGTMVSEWRASKYARASAPVYDFGASETLDGAENRAADLALRQAKKPYVAPAQLELGVTALGNRVVASAEQIAALKRIAEPHLGAMKLCLQRQRFDRPSDEPRVDWFVVRPEDSPLVAKVQHQGPLLPEVVRCVERELRVAPKSEDVPVGGWDIRFTLR